LIDDKPLAGVFDRKILIVIEGGVRERERTPALGSMTDPTVRGPLYTSTPGLVSLNLLDRNYSVHGSGVDAPVRSALVLLISW
jgi:hypothetical protein